MTFFSQNDVCEKFGVLSPNRAFSGWCDGMSKADGLKITVGDRYSLKASLQGQDIGREAVMRARSAVGKFSGGAGRRLQGE